MNDENLIPHSKRSKNEARENGKKGGKASGVTRRRKKAMKALAVELMNLPVGKSAQKDLKKLGIPADDMTNSMWVLVSMLQAATDGNVRAAEFLQTTMGESPALALKKKELALKEKALKQGVTVGGETSSGMLQLVESLKAAGEGDGISEVGQESL